MRTSRRTFLLAAGAASVVAAAHAKPPKPSGPYAAAANYSAQRRGVSMLVMREGKILFEDYPNAGGVEKAWELASGTKSFTGVMAAAAEQDRLLDIDEPCVETLPEWAGDRARSRIAIRHLLTLTSGLRGAGAIGRPPTYLDALKARAVHEPGQVFEYGPTDFQIFGEILKRKLRAKGLNPDPVIWFKGRVLDRISVSVADWKRGRDGNPFMPQGAQLTARNWARFGQWVMDGARGVDPHVARVLFESTSANPGYGLSWWLIRPGLIGPSPRAGVDEGEIGSFAQSEDIVMAAGAGDQRLYLIRKQNLIVVRQANQIMRGMFARGRGKWSDADFLELLATA